MKKGRFGFRLWFIRFLIESLMKSNIDEYEGHTIIAHRTKKTMTMGYVIGTGLINALVRLHSEISEAEKPNNCFNLTCGSEMKQLTKKKVKKLTVSKVQELVNKAIREHDGTCIVRDWKHQCNGILTASHFYSVGGNSSFRFYPPNIHAQCFGHHGIHERRQNPFFYREWMEKNEPEGLEFMRNNWGKTIRYNQVVLHDIKDFAQAGELEGLTKYIESLFNACV